MSTEPTASPSRPLTGIRILSFEQYGAGPYGSQLLADLGATVVKVEHPREGDVSRRTGPHLLGDGDSLFFQTFNAGKHSLALDLKAEGGRELLHRLLPRFDAVMNNLRGDQPARLGLDYASLGPLHPRVVCAHLSAYGRAGERADWPGYDYLMQAEAGFMALTGEPDGPPARFGLSMVDYMSGAVLATGLLAALLGAMQSGRGRDVDVSLFDVALHQLSYPAAWYLNAGHVTTRLPRSAHPGTVPCQLYRTRDGWVMVMCMLDKFWLALLDGLGLPELAADPRFVDAAARRAHRDVLTGILDRAFAADDTERWLEKLSGRLPIAPVHDLPQALANPYVAAIDGIREVPHPSGPLRLVASPIRIDGRRIDTRACPALGSDTEAVLADAGCSPDEIARWRRLGTLR